LTPWPTAPGWCRPRWAGRSPPLLARRSVIWSWCGSSPSGALSGVRSAPGGASSLVTCCLCVGGSYIIYFDFFLFFFFQKQDKVHRGIQEISQTLHNSRRSTIIKYTLARRLDKTGRT
jgi:hypothetical protein